MTDIEAVAAVEQPPLPDRAERVVSVFELKVGLRLLEFKASHEPGAARAALVDQLQRSWADFDLTKMNPGDRYSIEVDRWEDGSFHAEYRTTDGTTYELSVADRQVF